MAITQTPLSPTSARKAANASAYNANSNSGNPISSQNAFTALTNEITRVLGPSSGLTSEDVDAAYLQVLMENYVSKDSEWEKYAFEDLSRGYTRNLVDEGNGKSNLVCFHYDFPSLGVMGEDGYPMSLKDEREYS